MYLKFSDFLPALTKLIKFAIFSFIGKLYDHDEKLLQTFGNSKEFAKAAANALNGNKADSTESLRTSVDSAYKVAGCGYEHGTSWGIKVSAPSTFTAISFSLYRSHLLIFFK